jgi:hypothetical protein
MPSKPLCAICQKAAPPALIGAGIGLAFSFQGLGQFFQAIIYDPILKMVGGPGKPAFEVSAVAFAVLFFLALIVLSLNKDKIYHLKKEV